MKAFFYSDISVDEDRNRHIRHLEDYLEKYARHNKLTDDAELLSCSYKLKDGIINLDYHYSSCPVFMVVGVKVTVECSDEKSLENLVELLSLNKNYKQLLR